MFDSNDPLRVEYLDGRKWRLLESFTYFDPTFRYDDDPPGVSGEFIDVQAGFVTDFASIPRALWAVLPPTGEYGKAAVIHDWLYYRGHVGVQPITRRYADKIFRQAMLELGVAAHRRWLMWSAVRTFAGFLWAKHRLVRP